MMIIHPVAIFQKPMSQEVLWDIPFTHLDLILFGKTSEKLGLRIITENFIGNDSGEPEEGIFYRGGALKRGELYIIGSLPEVEYILT